MNITDRINELMENDPEGEKLEELNTLISEATEEIKNKWNDTADKYNQWDTLSSDEKLDLIIKG
jgi:arsenate reductase-like glutaredoxin family protein